MPAQYELHYSGNNGDSQIVAMYAPTGQLLKVGTPSEVQAEAIRLMNMKQVFERHFLMGQDSKDGVAKSLTELNQYRQGLQDAEALILRQQAAELIARAEQLEGN